MIVKLLTEQHLEFLSLKGSCTGSSESTLVKIPLCWKSHAAAQFIVYFCFIACGGFMSGTCWVCAELSVFSRFAITALGKRTSCFSLIVFLCFYVKVSVLCLFFAVSFATSHLIIWARKPVFNKFRFKPACSATETS